MRAGVRLHDRNVIMNTSEKVNSTSTSNSSPTEQCDLCRKDDADHERNEYHEYVHSLAKRWRHLQHLDDFMSEGYHDVPLKGTPQTHVRVIDISAVRAHVHPEMKTVDRLSDFLNNTLQTGQSR